VQGGAFGGLARIAVVALLAGALAGVATADETAAAPGAAAREQRTRQLVDEGLSRFNVGEYDEAAKRFTQAYLLQPLPELLYDLAQIAAKQGRREKAIELYRRYQGTLPPGEAQARAIDAKVNDLDEALKLETPPQRAARRLESGRALLAHGRLDDAEEELDRGYALDPQPAFLVALGDVSRQRNDRPTAMDRYHRFLATATDDDPQRPYVEATLAALQPATPTPPPPAPAPPRRSRRGLWWIALPAAAVVAAGLAVGIYFGTSADSSSVPMISVSLHK
jgi:tetratricopeptide (TPR) repeat protein